MRRTVFCWLILLLWQTSAYCAEATLESNTPQLVEGNFALLTLKVQADPGTQLQLPQLQQQVDDQQADLELVGSPQLMVPESGSLELQYRLWPLQAGDVEISSITVQSADDPPVTLAKTRPLHIQVLPRFNPDEEKQARGLKQVEIPFSFRYWWWVGVIAGVLVLLGLLFWKLSGNKQPAVKVEPPVPAGEWVRGRLKRLREQTVNDQQFYYDLSEIFREYLQRRYNLPFVGMTTQEFLPILDQKEWLKLEERLMLKDLWQKADLIKYADGSPTQTEMDKDYYLIYNLVDEIEKRHAASEAASEQVSGQDSSNPQTA